MGGGKGEGASSRTPEGSPREPLSKVGRAWERGARWLPQLYKLGGGSRWDRQGLHGERGFVEKLNHRARVNMEPGTCPLRRILKWEANRNGRNRRERRGDGSAYQRMVDTSP